MRSKTISVRTVTVSDAVLFTLLMFGANFVGTYTAILSFNLLGKLVGLDGPVSDPAKAVPVIVLDMAAAFGVVLLADFLFFRAKMEKWTKGSFSVDSMCRNYIVLVLPAECFRFLLCMLSQKPGKLFGYRFFDGVFTFIPGFLHDQFYLTPHGRWESVRESGFSAGDHLTFFLYYFGYFLASCTALYFLFRYLWKKQERQREKEERERLRMSPEQCPADLLTPHDERRMTWEDRLTFGAVSVGGQIAAYILAGLLFSVLLGMLPVAAQYPLRGFLYILLPLHLLGKHLDAVIPSLYSPAVTDDERCLRKKAVSLMLPGEILRFLAGLLPSPLLCYGMLTSPITALLFELLYLRPTERYEQVMAGDTPGAAGFAVFLLVYAAYYAAHGAVVFRMFRKRMIRYLREREAERMENEKYGR